MRRLSLLAETLETAKEEQKIEEALFEYFQNLPAKDAIWGLFFLCKKKLPPVFSSQNLRKSLLTEKNLPSWLLSLCQKQVGDWAETLALLFPPPASPSSLSLGYWIEQRIFPLYSLSLQQKMEAVLSWEKELFPQERSLLHKILLGRPLFDLPLERTLRAVHSAKKVPLPYLKRHLTQEWEPSPSFFEDLCNQTLPSEENALYPLPFPPIETLKHPLSDLGSPRDWIIEEYEDGLRTQAIKRGERRALWSEEWGFLNKRFPSLIEALNEVPFSYILTGVVLFYLDSKLIPFSLLQGQKEDSSLWARILPIFLINDLWEKNGEDLRLLPLEKRRQKLFRFLSSFPHPALRFSPSVRAPSWQRITQKGKDLRAKGKRGLLLRKKNAPLGSEKDASFYYEIDPLKIQTLLLYANKTEKEGTNLYSFYTLVLWEKDALIPIVRLESALPLEEKQAIDRWIRSHTEEKFGPVRRVIPQLVFEVAFKGALRSSRRKSGIVLLEPRLLRWRKDLSPQDADSLSLLLSLAFPN